MSEPGAQNIITAIDAALSQYPVTPPTLAGAHGKPAKCRRHSWVIIANALNQDAALHSLPMPDRRLICTRCGMVQDPERSRRGRNARKRGNGLQAKAAKAAGIANIGALGLPEDAGKSTDWLVLQVKSGLGYPKNLDRWLRALTATAGQLRGVVYVETPGPGRKAKRLIVLDYEEFLAWFGGNKP